MYTKTNIRTHSAEELHQLEWKVFPQPAYSPDIAPSDFYLFRFLCKVMLFRARHIQLYPTLSVHIFLICKHIDFKFGYVIL